MAATTEAVGAKGILIPRSVLDQHGLGETCRVRIDWSGTSLILTPTEADRDDIQRAAIRYLAEEVGDMTAMREPELHRDGWRVEVVIRPEYARIGALWFDLYGTLDRQRTTPVVDMDAAVEALIAARGTG